MGGTDEKDVDEEHDNRRHDPRHVACFPVVVESDKMPPRQALIRDLSISGALILTRRWFDVGDEITLHLHLDGDDEKPYEASGKVVRSTPLPPEAAGLWTRTVGVQFHTPLTEIEAKVVALAERQKHVRDGG